jgi:hypothetical protein
VVQQSPASFAVDAKASALSSTSSGSGGSDDTHAVWGSDARATPGGWLSSRSHGDRVSFQTAKGFTRQQRELGERFLMQEDASGVLQMFERSTAELDPVSMATAVNRLAKVSDGSIAIRDSRFMRMKECIAEQISSSTLPYDARSLSNIA